MSPRTDTVTFRSAAINPNTLLSGLLMLAMASTACDNKKAKAEGEGCVSGDACDVLEVRKNTSNGCIEFYNTSSRVVKLTIKAAAISFDDVYAKSTFVPKAGLGGGPCLQNFVYAYSANFK